MIALITGITGQDGSYLTEALLQRGDVVHGTVRRTSTLERSRLAHLYANPAIYNKQLFLHYAELEDITTLRRITDRVKPQQLYQNFSTPVQVKFSALRISLLRPRTLPCAR